MRASKNNTPAANNDFTKKEHYINFYERESGIELGYRTIDDLPEMYITIAQKSEAAADKLFGNAYQRAVYRQAGSKQVKESSINLDDF